MVYELVEHPQMVVRRHGHRPSVKGRTANARVLGQGKVGNVR